MKIRKGTFETNSSSTHSIVISKNKVEIPVGLCVHFNIGEYGWKTSEYNFADYMYTSLLYNNDEEGFKKLKSILDKWGVKYKFQKPKWSYYGDNQEEKYLDNGYIDHGDETYDIMRKILNDEDLLARALFGDSTVYTGNDNSSEGVPHLNHIPDKYDYFFKGN